MHYCTKTEILIQATWRRDDAGSLSETFASAAAVYARCGRRADVRAWRERARWDAPDFPSLFKALVVARERLAEGRLRADLWVRFSFFADALP